MSSINLQSPGVHFVPYMSLFLIYLFLFSDCCVFFDLWEYNDNILKFFFPSLSLFLSISLFSLGLFQSLYFFKCLIAQILEMSRSGLGVSHCLVSILLNPPPSVCALISPLKSSPVHILHRTNFHSHWNVGRNQDLSLVKTTIQSSCFQHHPHCWLSLSEVLKWKPGCFSMSLISSLGFSF